MANDEYLTPKKYIKSIKEVLGEDFTDLFSSKLANDRIGAKNYITKEDDAFTFIWHGNCYANPPYSRGNLPKYSSYLLDCFNGRQITNSLSLVPNYTSEKWFQPLIKHSHSIICLTNHRIKFTTFEKGRFVENSSPEFGNAFIYIGYEQEKFIEVFRKWGTILRIV